VANLNFLGKLNSCVRLLERNNHLGGKSVRNSEVESYDGGFCKIEKREKNNVNNLNRQGAAKGMRQGGLVYWRREEMERLVRQNKGFHCFLINCF